MKNLNSNAPSDNVKVLDRSSVEALASNLRGNILSPGDDGYHQARTVWNAMIDKRPALIVQCSGVSDVIEAVNFARLHDLLVSVRGGGHNVAGNAVCDAGLMIDFSAMRSVRVDPASQTARAEPGLTWGEFDAETQAFGLATTGGVVSHTGVSGLTLGGGLGWLMGKYGLTCDNLLSVDLVTADGQLLTANTTQNQDLFWGIRGGGGNFGVVTSFEFQLHPVGPTVLGGMILYPLNDARNVLKFYREFSRSGPENLMAFAGILSTPDGIPVVSIIVGWFGNMDEGERYLELLRTFGSPVADMIGPMPYRQLQTLYDDAVPFGLRRYWKSGYLPELSDELIDLIVGHASKKTSPLSSVVFFHLRGAASRVNPDETAFIHRQDQWDIDIIAQWDNADETDKHVDWTREFWKAIEPHSNGVYVNHLDRDDKERRVRSAYGENFDRLVNLKNKYDPENFFRLNNNIKPPK